MLISWHTMIQFQTPYICRGVSSNLEEHRVEVVCFRPLTFVGGLVPNMSDSNIPCSFQTPYICRGFSSIIFSETAKGKFQTPYICRGFSSESKGTSKSNGCFRPLTFVGGLVQ